MTCNATTYRAELTDNDIIRLPLVLIVKVRPASQAPRVQHQVIQLERNTMSEIQQYIDALNA